MRHRRRVVVGAVAGALLLAAGCTSPAPQPSATTTAEPAPEDAPRVPSPSSPPDAPASPALVTSVSQDRRQLLDQRGDPILLHGETLWTAMQNLDPAALEAHLEHRAEQGFNAVLMTPVPWSGQDGETLTTPDGLRPFEDDGTTLVEAYWQRLDAVLAAARAQGITVFLASSGISAQAEAAGRDWGPDDERAVGRALGARYASTPGIVWLQGVDYRAEDWDEHDPELLAFVDGLREAGDAHPVTVQYYNDDSISHDNPRWRGVYDIEAAYTYRPTYGPVLAAYGVGDGPVVFVEGNFEAENNEGGPPTTDQTLRRQMLWTYTSGGAGAVYGHSKVWRFDGDWQTAVDPPSVAQLGGIHELFQSLAWWELVPDVDESCVPGGRGEKVTSGTLDGGFADVLESDYATAACAPDGSLATVYVPTARTVSVARSRLAEVSRARWFDPTSGEVRDVAVAESYTTPGPNAAGSEDWLLVLDAP